MHLIKYYMRLQTVVSKYIFICQGKEKFKLIAALQGSFFQLAAFSAFPFNGHALDLTSAFLILFFTEVIRMPGVGFCSHLHLSIAIG